MHNKESYPDPAAFRPEHYLTRAPDGDWAYDPAATDPRAAAFGFGSRCAQSAARRSSTCSPCRRMCPGQPFTAQALFVTLRRVRDRAARAGFIS
jgi:hypothetical protein